MDDCVSAAAARAEAPSCPGILVAGPRYQDVVAWMHGARELPPAADLAATVVTWLVPSPAPWAPGTERPTCLVYGGELGAFDIKALRTLLLSTNGSPPPCDKVVLALDATDKKATEGVHELLEMLAMVLDSAKDKTVLVLGMIPRGRVLGAQVPLLELEKVAEPLRGLTTADVAVQLVEY